MAAISNFTGTSREMAEILKQGDCIDLIFGSISKTRAKAFASTLSQYAGERVHFIAPSPDDPQRVRYFTGGKDNAGNIAQLKKPL